MPVPSGFQQIGDGSWAVVERPGSSKGKVLRSYFTGTPGPHHALYTKPGQHSEVDFLALTGRIGEHSAPRIMGLLARAQAADGKTSGYALHLAAGGYAITRLTEDVPTQLGFVSFDWTWTEFTWLRINCAGTTISGQVWRDGEPKPLEWGLQINDASYSIGYVGTASWE